MKRGAVSSEFPARRRAIDPFHPGRGSLTLDPDEFPRRRPMFLPRRDFLRLLPATLLAGRSTDEPGKSDSLGDGDEAILAALRPLRKKSDSPGLTAAIVRIDRPTRVAAVGVRKS